MKFNFLGTLLVVMAVLAFGAFASPSFAQGEPTPADATELAEGAAPSPDVEVEPAKAVPAVALQEEGQPPAQDLPGIGEKVAPVDGKPVAEPAEMGWFATKISDANAAIEPALADTLGKVNGVVWKALMFDASFGGLEDNRFLSEDGKETPVKFPFIVGILMIGALFFTLFFKFINFRGFKHAINVVRGKYDNPEDKGEISHFRALTSALSATVGLGNIAGVALAIRLGGPGAVFWMVTMALFGMSAKFSSCTLAQLYRRENKDGSISGGPMYYLDMGLKKKGPVFGVVGKVLAVMFAVMVMGGAIGGGNMFQGNQTAAAIASTFQTNNEVTGFVVGILLAAAVGAVILGGIKRIGAATSRIIPLMCGFYVIACGYVIITNAGAIPAAFGLIFSSAFNNNAIFGGAVGVLIMGVQRAAFSNEAGLGSAAIAHAAAKTDEPVREGMVAMLGPFIDTVIICLMTGLTVIVTGVWSPEALHNGAPIAAGVPMMTAAFDKALGFGDEALSIAVVLFAYSTMISWCYYGERGWIYLLDHFGGRGIQSVIVFRGIFVFFVFVGAVLSLGPVIAFSDAMIFCMAFPNIVGSIILAPIVARKLNDYWSRYKSGEMKPYEPTDTSAVAMTNN